MGFGSLPPLKALLGKQREGLGGPTLTSFLDFSSEAGPHS